MYWERAVRWKERDEGVERILNKTRKTEKERVDMYLMINRKKGRDRNQIYKERGKSKRKK